MITDARQFSNLGLLLRFDIDVAELTNLIDRLAVAHISVDDESRAAIAGLRSGNGELEATLHIRFYGEEPYDLRIPTPAVPG